MSPEKNTVLTDTKRNLIRGEYEGSRQAINDHKSSIRDNVHGVLGDFQFLFEHSDDEILEYMFQEGHALESGPLNFLDTHNPVGFGQSDLLTKHIDSDGRPRDPEYNPDAKTRLEWWAERNFGPSKASPETQERLIDCIAFLCRVAETGLLNPQDLLERGIERYYQEHDHKENQLATVKTWSEDIYGSQLEQNKRKIDEWDAEKEKADDPATVPKPPLRDIPEEMSMRARLRYLERQGMTENSDD